MNESDDLSRARVCGRGWGLCLAAVFGGFCLFFLSGLVFQSDDPRWTVFSYGLAVLLTAWFGLICAGGIALCLGYAGAERFVDSSLSLGAAALFAGMVISTCAEACKRIAGAAPAEIGDGTALVLVLLWAGIGVLSFQTRTGPAPSP